MLKTIRVILSVIFFGLITFYFVDFAGLLPQEYSLLAKIQFIPALLALNVAALLFIIVLTLLFGRIYCSSICPMGIYQDIIAWISKKVAKKKKRYTYSPAKNILRIAVLVVGISTFIMQFPLILSLIDPYSAYGRIAVSLFRPVYMFGNNILESIFTSFGDYTFYRVDIFVFSYFALVVSVVTLLVIGLFAWKYGRTYCNTICPVGTILGFLSKFSLLKVRIESSGCNSCGLCAMKCKASCIDSKNHKVDHSRCVTCFNCLSSCKKGSLRYGMPGKTNINVNPVSVDAGKRQFLVTALTTVASVPAVWAKDKIGHISNAKAYTRQTPISPPGAVSAGHLRKHCTSCHLCISKCPTSVLKPALMEYGIGGMMQPVMFFEKGFCNYDCTICSNVCPNGALHPLTKEEKHLTQVGKVIFKEDICVVITEGTNCGACAEHCPTQAVTMKPYKDGLTLPQIDPDICVGCGGCEFICPVRPYRAIFVEGNSVQLQAKPFDVEEAHDYEIDDFGF